MKNIYRDHNCGELNIKNVGQNVKLAGWVQRIRNLGAMKFIDLRDEFGITQLVISDEEKLKDIKENGYEIIVTSLDTKNSIYDIEYNKKVIVIGNEGNGVSKEIQDFADYKVKIPMLGKTESLNASVATGIMIYEYVRGKLKK